MRKKSIQDIAREAKVSVSTVSRVLCDKPYVRAELKDRVLKAMQANGYKPKTVTRRDVIAIGVADWEKGPLGLYENMLLSGLIRSLQNANVQIEIIPLQSLREQIGHNVSLLIELGIDKFVCLDLARERKLQLILVNDFNQEAHCIYMDHAGEIDLAMTHLVGKGHRRIALLRKAHRGSWGNHERLRGYREASERLGLEIDDALIKDFTEQDIMETLCKLLMVGRPTALIVCGESSLLPVNYALQLLGKRVPDDISIVAFEAPTVSKFVFPATTCINQNLEQLGKLVGEKALEILAKPSMPKLELTLKSTLIERDSVKTIRKH